jgi:dTDP-4-dehydrorhamnose 3,5-epimerase
MTICEHNIIKGVFEIQLEAKEDHRGFFMRTYHEELFEKYGIARPWIQEYQSLSLKKNTIRGLHFQMPPYAETKLIRVTQGGIFDVFIDLRQGSPTFGNWGSMILSAENKKMAYIPKGFAHGFCSLIDTTAVVCKMDEMYAPEAEYQIIWNDPKLAIPWPLKGEVIISQKDIQAKTLTDFINTHGSLKI